MAARQQLAKPAVGTAVGLLMLVSVAWNPLAGQGPTGAQPIPLGPYDGVVLDWKQRAVIASRFERQVVELAVEEGDYVKQGDVLARLDDQEAKLAVEERKAATSRARAEVALQRALLEESIAQLEANQYLREKNAISPEEYRQSQVRVQVQRQRVVAAERDLDQAEVALRQAQLLYEEHTIRSPMNARVVRVFYRKGSFVDRSGEHGMRLFELVNVDVLRAVVRVPLRDAFKISRGMPVRFQVAMEQLQGTELARRVFHGKVTFLGEIDPVDGTRELWADIYNDDHLLEAQLMGQLTILSNVGPKQARLLQR